MTLIDLPLKPTVPRRAVASRYYMTGGKRLFDLVASVLLLPIIIPVILLVLCVSSMIGTTGFYAHLRIGKNGKAFRCWKFRTMIDGSANELREMLDSRPDQAIEWARYRKLDKDPRVLPFGRFLRWTSLDELPQIWNVIRGDMSLVGPRPVTRTELRFYGAAARKYLNVRPGITGIWQVSGRRSATFAERVKMDKAYIRNITFSVDITLLLRTIPLIILPNGR